MEVSCRFHAIDELVSVELVGWYLVRRLEWLELRVGTCFAVRQYDVGVGIGADAGLQALHGVAIRIKGRMKMRDPEGADVDEFVVFDHTCESVRVRNTDAGIPMPGV